MASFKHTFTSGQTVTPARLNDARDVFDIVNADIKSNAAIAHSKLANIPSGQLLLGNGSNVPTATALSGDVTVNSSGVTAIGSGVIVDADISATAAIAGTKIAPNFGSQNVATSGRYLAGSSSNTNDFNGITPSILAEGVTNYDHATVGVIHNRADSNAGFIVLGKTRATTSGGLTAVQAADVLGSMVWHGSDGTAMIRAASISAAVDGTPGTNDMPGRLVFSTTADGASSVTERMRITQAGNVGIANTSPTEKLHVTGNIKASGYIDADTSFRGQASDSAAAPSFTWTGDTNTGMFRPAADTLAFCEGGVEAMRISDNGSILIGTTTAVDPAQGSTDGATFWLGQDLRISNTGPALRLRRRSTDGTTMSFSRDTTTVGTISVTTTATAYNTSSDYRLKENPSPLIGGLATINQLQPCEFTWKSEGSIGRGFIAHELQAVVPEAVTGEKDAVDADGNPEYQGVDAAKLVPYLVSAIKELKNRVEALEAV